MVIPWGKGFLTKSAFVTIIETTLTYKSEHSTQVDTNLKEIILYYLYSKELV